MIKIFFPILFAALLFSGIIFSTAVQSLLWASQYTPIKVNLACELMKWGGISTIITLVLFIAALPRSVKK